MTPIGEVPISVGYDGIAHGRGAVSLATRSSEFGWRERVILTTGAAAPGRTLKLHYRRGTTQTIVVRPYRPDLLSEVTTGIRVGSAIVFIAFGCMLLARRPSSATFGFMLFAIAFAPYYEHGIAAFGGPGVALVQLYANDIFEPLGILGLQLFCRQLFGGSRVGDRAITMLAIIALALLVYCELSVQTFGIPAALPFLVAQVAIVAALLIILATLFVAYGKSSATQKPKLRWILSSLSVGIPLYLWAYVAVNLDLGRFAPSLYATNLLYASTIVIPAAVSYVVLRHHLLDLGFFVSKGAVYGILGAVIFFCVEEALTLAKHVPEGRGSSFVTTGLAAVGFLFIRLRPFLEQTLATVFARRRSEAIGLLRQRSRTLFAESSATSVRERMVREPTEVLDLAGTAIVTSAGAMGLSGCYEGRGADLVDLVRDTSFRSAVGAAPEWVRVVRERFPVLQRFHDSDQPLIAMALDEPGDGYAIFVASPHTDGTDLDAEERTALYQFVDRATIALLYGALAARGEAFA